MATRDLIIPPEVATTELRPRLSPLPFFSLIAIPSSTLPSFYDIPPVLPSFYDILPSVLPSFYDIPPSVLPSFLDIPPSVLP